jgi:hypothetical protein
MVVYYPEEFKHQTIEVKIQVSDGIDRTDEHIKIRVSQNWPPELIMELPNVMFQEDHVVYNHLNLNNYFYDQDEDILFYTYGNEHVNVIIYDDGSIDFSAEENWYGVENITIRATEEKLGALVEDVITVTVVPVNDAPGFIPIPDQNGTKGEIWMLDLRPYIFDVDNDINDLSIKCSSRYATIAGTVLIFLYPEEINEETILLSIQDPDKENSTITFNVTLKEPVVPVKKEVDYSLTAFYILLIIVVLATVLIAYAFHQGKYEVEELFLVYGKSGILMSHRHKGLVDKFDRDIMAGMFTAVQDFVSDVFEADGTKKTRIRVMDLDDKKVMIERGKYIYLAVVFEGGTWKLASRVKSKVAKMEKDNKDLLKNWLGITDNLDVIHESLDELLYQK